LKKEGKYLTFIILSFSPLTRGSTPTEESEGGGDF